MNRYEILHMPAGKKLDFIILRDVMKWTPVYVEGGSLFGVPGELDSWIDGNRKSRPLGTSPSTDISDAWELVEKIVGKDCLDQDLFIECWSDGEWYVSFRPLGYSNREPAAVCDGKTSGSPSAPLAICRAALLKEISE